MHEKAVFEERRESIAKKVVEEEEKEVIRVVCAWCGKDLGEKSGGSGVSHSICPECKEVVIQDLKKI